MKSPTNSDVEECLYNWRSNRGGTQLPLPEDPEELFKVMRDSDILDIRGVIALQVHEEQTNPYFDERAIYCGIEDAIRTLYTPGCKFYTRGLQLRMVTPLGLMIEFHRMEYLNMYNATQIPLGTYLLVVSESMVTRRRCKVKLIWSDEDGKHRN